MTAVVGIVLGAILALVTAWATPAPAQGTGAPVIDSFTATFDQATYTTTYTVAARDPDGDALTYTWELRHRAGEESCGTFAGSGSTARWTHPHESQQGLVPGFTGVYCQDSAQQTGGHPGIVVVTVSDGSSRCTLEYPQGSVPGTVEVVAAACETTATTTQPSSTTTSTTATSTTAATSTAAPTTTATATTTPPTSLVSDGGGGGGIPGGIIVIGGLGLGIGCGIILVLRRDRDPCPELLRRLRAAEVAAAEAESRLHDARAVAEQARDAWRDARYDRQDLEQTRRRLDQSPAADEPWIESDGERITRHDLRLRARAAVGAFGRWLDGEMDGGEVQGYWNGLDTPEARAARREQDAAERAATREQVEAELAAAQAREDEAQRAAADATRAEREAQAAAERAAEEAAAARAAAAPCLHGPVTPAGPTGGDDGGDGDGDGDGDGGGGGGDDDHPPDGEQPCRCGPDVSIILAKAMNQIAATLEDGWNGVWVAVLAPSATASTIDLFLGILNAVAGELSDAVGGPTDHPATDVSVSVRAGYGLLWLMSNADNADLWIARTGELAVPGCPHCPKCVEGKTPPVTLLGACLEPHNINDFLYGFLCGWWGISGLARDLGAWWAENSKGAPPGMRRDAKDPILSRAVNEVRIAARNWQIDAVSRPAYAVGAQLGYEIATSQRTITSSDFGPLVGGADKRPGCEPCYAHAKAWNKSLMTTGIRWPGTNHPVTKLRRPEASTDPDG